MSKKYKKSKIVHYYRTQYTVSSSGIFKSVVLILLIVLVVGVLLHGTDYDNMLTLSGFLNVIENAPAIPTDWISFGGTIPDNILSLPVIGAVLNFFVSAIEVLMFFVVGISQSIVYILYFLKILFGV